MEIRRTVLAVALVLVACGGGGGGGDGPPADAGPPPPDARPDGLAPDTGPPDAGATDAGPMDAGTTCPRAPRDPALARAVLVSHPYTADGAQSAAWERLTLTASGELETTGESFTLGRATGGEMVFTPDGEIGLVPQEDGTLGVVRIADAGVTVVDPAFDGGFYASGVVMAPDGTHAFVLDSEFEDIGGGVYRVDIGCDGTLSGATRVLPAKLPYGLVLREGGGAVLAVREVAGADASADLVLLDAVAAGSVVAGADAFGDEESIMTGPAVTRDGRFVLVGDNAAFSGMGTRVAVAEIGDSALTARQVVDGLEDPMDLVTSPFDDAALVVSGFGDALFRLSYDPDATPPFVNAGELSYSGGRPQLPGAAVLVDRGPLEGLVLVAENVGVRRVRFEGDGSITDLGLFSLGAGTDRVVGALGVQ